MVQEMDREIEGRKNQKTRKGKGKVFGDSGEMIGKSGRKGGKALDSTWKNEMGERNCS